MAGKSERGGLRPLSRRSLKRIHRAVAAAEQSTGLQICVWVGPSTDDSRSHAEAMFVEAGLHERPGVLVMVAPPQRRVEVVTAPAVVDKLPDAACRAAVEHMTARFAAGDLEGGVLAGLHELARVAGAGAPSGGKLPNVLDEQ